MATIEVLPPTRSVTLPEARGQQGADQGGSGHQETDLPQLEPEVLADGGGEDAEWPE